MLEGADDIRSRLLQAKLTKFLTDPTLLRSTESEEYRGRLLDDDAQAGPIGETLFMVLEKVTDLRKPELLAKAFAHYLKGQMSRNEMLLLSHAIDVGSIVDIQEFIQVRGSGNGSAGWNERLATVGLLKATVQSPMEGVAYFVYTLSPVGKHFLEALDSAEQSRNRDDSRSN
jgi:hypothetical protein